VGGWGRAAPRRAWGLALRQPGTDAQRGRWEGWAWCDCPLFAPNQPLQTPSLCVRACARVCGWAARCATWAWRRRWRISAPSCAPSAARSAPAHARARSPAHVRVRARAYMRTARTQGYARTHTHARTAQGTCQVATRSRAERGWAADKGQGHARAPARHAPPPDARQTRASSRCPSDTRLLQMRTSPQSDEQLATRVCVCVCVCVCVVVSRGSCRRNCC
jgi:hypothetical protein